MLRSSQSFSKLISYYRLTRKSYGAKGKNSYVGELLAYKIVNEYAFDTIERRTLT